MFGGQDDSARPGAGGAQDDTLNGVTDLVGGAAAPNDGNSPADAADNSGYMPAPSEPVQSSVPAPTEEAEDIAAGSDPAPAPQDDAPAASPPAPTTSDDDVSDELMELKQKALQQLTPLVGHLEQTPEEKFRTTMMLIQASDNKSLLKEAYEAAQGIENEKLRAQALLDVVNEINYFHQNSQQN